MSKEEIIELIKEKIKRAEENMEESQQFGTNTPGFNQDLGYRDALVYLLNEIESD